MLAFPAMLISPAKNAGIKVPPDIENFNQDKYPHWIVYCNMQLGAALPYFTAHWDNAKIIAKIPNNKIKEITFCDLISLGYHIKT